MDEEWNVNGSYMSIEGIHLLTEESSARWLTQSAVANL